jgi:carboxymethylenebutenolidase
MGDYLGVPQPAVTGAGPWPGVVVVHDAFGLTDDTREIVDRFASTGYVTVAPDLYGPGRAAGSGRLACMRSAFAELQQGAGPVVDAILAARDTLIARPDCSGAVGVAGFCMGGGFALLTAPRGFEVAAPFYGQLPEPLPEALRGTCPIVGSYGSRDRILPDAAPKLRRALADLDVEYDVREYPEAGHGFANRLPFGPAAPLLRVMGLGYHHDSAADAWQRVFAFFATHLSAVPVAGG